jgi:dihydrofolate reductase
MRPVRYSVAASLDGYIADSSGGFDWIPQDPTVDFAAIFARVDTVLLGRRTYELTRQSGAPPWGSNMRVYVFSRTLRPEAYPEVTVIAGDAAAVVAALRAEAGTGDIWLFGGGQLFSSLLAAGQVDQGGGVPLVAGGIPRTELRLERTHQYPSGMVSLTYAVERRAV